MSTTNEQSTMTLKELMISSLAQADALAKLLIEKGVITEAEFMNRLVAEKACYQGLLQQKIG